MKPPDLRDGKMVGEDDGKLLVLAVSEGGLVEPFRSAGSAMPAWKDVLSIEDRWAVIAYQHTFSGHGGPHVTSEHPESVMASHTGPAGAASPAAQTPRGEPPSSSSHRH